jgi:hypothetical protein
VAAPARSLSLVLVVEVRRRRRQRRIDRLGQQDRRPPGSLLGLTTGTLARVTGRLRIADRSRWLLLGLLALRTPGSRQPPRPRNPKETRWACTIPT